MIRPRPARWFEILAARDDATLALGALGRSGAVELEARSSVVLPAALADLRPRLAELAELGARYRAYWPSAGAAASPFPEAPSLTLARSLACVRTWAVEAEPLIDMLQRAGAERAELVLWRRVLAAIGDTPIDFAALAAAGPVLQAGLFVLPLQSSPELPPGALVRAIETDAESLCLLAVGSAGAMRALTEQTALWKGRACPAPAWLSHDAAQTEAHIAPRLAALAADEARLHRELERLSSRHGLARGLADAERLEWVIRNVRALESGELFCWITGWTSDLSGRRVAMAIQASGARALLHFPPPPDDAQAPLLLDNPRWVRPFEIFSRALGMPSRFEADPSTLLAFAVPLLFGYMFGDVGQGLVIAAAGCALRHRYPIARLFIAGGIAAAFFGMLFGSVFSLHGIVAPLWVDPLAHPLAVLAVPLAGGAVLLALGLALDALEAWWRGELRAWTMTDGGYALAYLGLIAGVIEPGAFAIAAAGALVYCIGHAHRARRATAALTALAELAERLLQILINTLSFARVGAFALAHAGLSAAIVALTDAADHHAGKALVLIAGNALVLALETMVVSIQTTRLVLFEFFTRFLAGNGRVFRPLAAPPSIAQEKS